MEREALCAGSLSSFIQTETGNGDGSPLTQHARHDLVLLAALFLTPTHGTTPRTSLNKLDSHGKLSLTNRLQELSLL
jgi:hypothetical protein